MGMLVRPFILRTKTCSLLPPFSLLLAGCQSLPLRTPPAGVLEPVEVLRLLQQRHISLQEGGGGGRPHTTGSDWHVQYPPGGKSRAARGQGYA
jgi:hypothetical protein